MARLVAEDSDVVFEVPSGETAVGRGPLLKIMDKRVSRNHAALEWKNGSLKLCPRHHNPCFLKLAGESEYTALVRDQWVELHHGDHIALLPDTLRYQVELVTRNELQEISEKTSHEGNSTAAATPPLPVDGGRENWRENTVATVTSTGRKRILPSWLSDVNTTTGSSKPAARKPATNKPATNRTATNKPATNRTATNKPATNRTATNKPATNRTATNKPATNRTATNKPATNRTATNKPATNRTATNKPATNRTATNKPATNRTATNKPATNKPATNKTTEAASSKESESTANRKMVAVSSTAAASPSMDDTNTRREREGEEDSSPPAKTARLDAAPPCPYGVDCYRKNPAHFRDYSHPSEEEDRPECPYGSDCYRKNPAHHRNFKHSGPPTKPLRQKAARQARTTTRKTKRVSALAGDSDESETPNTYDYIDSFIDDMEGSSGSTSYGGESGDSDWGPPGRGEGEGQEEGSLGANEVGELVDEAEGFMTNKKMWQP